MGLRVLGSGSLGVRGLTTAPATIRPGATLAYHQHPFSEVIVVVGGAAEVHVEGRLYRLKPFDAQHLPTATAHAMDNVSADVLAVLHSSFASDHPMREPVSALRSTSNWPVRRPLANRKPRLPAQRWATPARCPGALRRRTRWSCSARSTT